MIMLNIEDLLNSLDNQLKNNGSNNSNSMSKVDIYGLYEIIFNKMLFLRLSRILSLVKQLVKCLSIESRRIWNMVSSRNVSS